MSIHAISWALKDSRAEHGARLVLFSMAHHANDEAEVWCSISTYMAETRLSERAVRTALRDLERLGEIAWTGNTHRSGTRVYVVQMGEGQNLPGAESWAESAPEPKALGSTVSTSLSPTAELQSCAPSSRDELFEALYLIQTGEKYTAETKISPRERGKINKARAELKAGGYSATDVLAAIPGWPVAMGDLNITALGLSGNMRRCLNAAAGVVFRQEAQRETVEDRALKLVQEHMAEEELRAIEIGEVLT